MAMVLKVYSGVLNRMVEACSSDLYGMRLLDSPLSSPEFEFDVESDL